MTTLTLLLIFFAGYLPALHWVIKEEFKFYNKKRRRSP